MSKRQLINLNRDAALETFNDGIDRAGECTKKTITLGKIKTNNLWFGSECREKLAKMLQALRKFIKNGTKTGANELQTIYREERKKYKSLIKERESEMMMMMIIMIIYIAPQQQLYQLLALYRSTNVIKHISILKS